MNYKFISFLLSWIFPTKADRTVFRHLCKSIETRKESEVIRKRQITLLKHLKKEAQKRKLKVVFLNSQNAKWAYQSLYEEFANNPNFEPQVLITVGDKLLKKKYSHLNYKKMAKENFDFFAKRNMNVAYAFDFEKEKYINLEVFKPDIIFYEQPWWLAKAHNIFSTSNYALPFYCSYGSCITNGSNEYSEVFFQDVYKYFLDNDFIKTVLLEHDFDESRLDVAGQLKLDAYTKPIDTTKTLWKTTNKKRIIYAPHHSFYEDSLLRYGTFDWNYKFFYNYASKHPEYEFILKPHPELKRQIIRQNLMTVDQMNQYFKMWAELPNVQIYESGSYFDMFRTSDLLVTDCNSFLFEYLPTNKPVIHLVSSKSVGHNEYGQKIISGYYSAKNVNEIEKLMEQLLEKDIDPLKEVRTKILKNDIKQPKDGVSKYIVNQIEKICGIKE